MKDKCIDLRYPRDSKDRWFFFLTDAHWDNPKTDLSYLKRHLDLAKKRDAKVFALGDLFCAMQGKYDRRGVKSDIRPEHNTATYLDDLVNTAVDWFAPYKDIFALITPGNHETAILKNHETDLTKRFAEAMGCPTGPYQGFVRLRFSNHGGKTNTRTVVMAYHHGYGGGGPVTKGVIQANRQSVYLPDADVVVSGHTHDRWVMPWERIRLLANGTTVQTSQWHVKSGTYKNEFTGNGWAVEKGAPPRSLGGVFMKISTHREYNDIQFEFPQ